jgi:predicted dehydrogenase
MGRITQCVISVHRSGLIRDEEGQFPGLVRQPLMRTEPRLIIAESLIHQLDVARWLIGRLVLKGVVASHVSPEVVGEDSATLLLEGPSATSVVVMGSMTVAGTDSRAGDRFVLTGSRASLVYEKGRLSVRGDRIIDEHFDEDAAYQASFDGAIAHFVSALASGKPFETEPEDNLNVLRLVEDAYTALASQPISTSSL